MLFVAFCSSFWFLVRVSICSSLPFAARYGFLLLVMAFCCSLWLFVARFGILWMFPFEHRIARCGFLLVRNLNQNEQQKAKWSKWKPGFRDSK